MRYIISILVFQILLSLFAFGYESNKTGITVNKKADHKNINSLFILQAKESTIKDVPDAYIRILIQDWIRPGMNINDFLKLESTSKKDILEWEKIALENGYNVITRDKINVLLNEYKLSQAGLTNNIEVGKIVGADAILVIDCKNLTGIGFDASAIIKDIRLISVKTGEILFIANFLSIAGKGCPPEKIIEDANASVIWTTNVFKNYKKQLGEQNKINR